MSHFTVMVISNEPLNNESLQPILQPWHEYECTGFKDQYVVDVDQTDEVAEIFNKDVGVVVLAGGETVDRYDERLYVVEDGEFGKRKTFQLPEGAVEQKMPAEEARKLGLGYKTMAECAEEYFGIEDERDGRFYRKTNPNAKWDWWQIGGRWSGMLKPKYDPAKDPANLDASGKAKWPSEWTDIGNIAQIKDIAIDEIRGESEAQELAIYDKAIEIVAGRSFHTWEEVRTSLGDDIEKARKAFNDQPVVADLKSAELLPFFDVDSFLNKIRMSREEVAVRARRRALQTYAVVKDGKWYERGEMGWFGMSTNEKDPDAWDKEFSDLLDGLSPETWIAIVDCHI